MFSLNRVLSKTILKQTVSKYMVNVDLLRILGFKFPWFLNHNGLKNLSTRSSKEYFCQIVSKMVQRIK